MSTDKTNCIQQTIFLSRFQRYLKYFNYTAKAYKVTIQSLYFNLKNLYKLFKILLGNNYLFVVNVHIRLKNYFKSYLKSFIFKLRNLNSFAQNDE